METGQTPKHNISQHWKAELRRVPFSSLPPLDILVCQITTIIKIYLASIKGRHCTEHAT